MTLPYRKKLIEVALPLPEINEALFERVVMSPLKVSPLVRQLHPDAATVFKDSYFVEFLDRLRRGIPRPTFNAVWSSNSRTS